MIRRMRRYCCSAACLMIVPGTAVAQDVVVAPATMPRLSTVDERYQSYNVEMLEVTGGKFWKPYSSVVQATPKQDGNAPMGMDPNLYEYRAPIDLSQPRLRKLAAALGPAYIRVSGTWANSTYFQDEAGPAMANPPAGFNGVLTQQQWKGVIDFSKAVDAEIVTSFATSVGTRNAEGVWSPKEADKVLAFTRAAGGRIAAAEFMNEPTFAMMGGAPKGYNASSFAKDIAVFHPYLKKAAPEIVQLGPGSVGEGGALAFPVPGLIHTTDMLQSTGNVFDVFSYHYYGGVSNRCSIGAPGAGTTANAALTNAWLTQTDTVEAYYAKLRDTYAPGKAIWLTETGETACGGDPWASTFLDSFRYLYQLGSLAQRGVKVVMHNTLAASDYALLTEKTYEPRPNYWSALLWRRLMGTTVLQPAKPTSPELHLFAHCLRGVRGGVAILAINTDPQADPKAGHTLTLPVASERYTLSAKELAGGHVSLNGVQLELGADDAFPEMKGESVAAGSIVLAPATITFLAVPDAQNRVCQ